MSPPHRAWWCCNSYPSHSYTLVYGFHGKRGLQRILSSQSWISACEEMVKYSHSKQSCILWPVSNVKMLHLLFARHRRPAACLENQAGYLWWRTWESVQDLHAQQIHHCPLLHHQNNSSHFPRLLIFNMPILHPENSPSLILSAACGCQDIWSWSTSTFELTFTFNADMPRDDFAHICVILYLKYLLKYDYSIPPRFPVVNLGSNH